jgi:hypothetical protein
MEAGRGAGLLPRLRPAAPVKDREGVGMRCTTAALALVSALVLPAAAAARWRIDAAGGAIIPTNEVELGEGEDTIRTDFEAGGSFAVGGGYGLGDWVDLTAHSQFSFSGAEDLGFEESLDVYSFTAGGRVFLMPPGRFRPWLAGEIGWYRAEVESELRLFAPEIDQRDDSFGINVGGGLDVFVHRIVSLGVDVRYHDAFDALDGLEFVTTMFNVGIHLGR